MTKMLSAAVVAACVAWCAEGAGVWQETPTGVEIVGERVRVRLENGRVTSVAAKAGGPSLAACSPTNDTASGLGSLPPGAEREFSGCHADFAVPQVWSPPLERAKKFYRRPDGRSRLRVRDMGDGRCAVGWKGLTGEDGFHPEDTLVFVAGVEADGAVAVSAKVKSADGGVFGTRIAVDGVRTDAALVLPVMSGLRFPLNEMPDGEAAFLSGGYRLEAPMVLAETADTSYAMWSEDDTFVPYMAFCRKEGAAASFALEFNAPMPFEDRMSATTPVVKFDAFPGGNWQTAARPYRTWYRKRFAAELAVRDGNGPSDIRVVMQDAMHRLKPEQLDELQTTYGNHLLWYVSKLTEEFTHTWKWDWLLPGHTPDLQLLPRVRDIRRRGIRLACYVIGHCVNYGSPMFEREDMASYAKPPANRIAAYAPPGARKMGWSGFETNALVYVDMNVRRWRERMLDLHENMVRAFDLDTVYEDCLGCTHDPGNGVVDGTWGGQGASLFAREVLFRLKRPIMSEYGGAPIAFATKWPLVQTDKFADKPDFVRFRSHHQLPLCTYLFGYRPWNLGSHPWLEDSDDKILHLAACADAIGGLGFVIPPPYKKELSAFAHVNQRARLFNDKALEPYFPDDDRYPPDAVCLYRGTDGIYVYSDDGKVQKMTGPDGRTIYVR